MSLSEAGADKGLLERVLEGLSETIDTQTGKAAKLLNRFIESIAVMIVTSCLIPLLVLLFFLWLVKTVTGIDTNELIRRRRAEHRADSASVR